MFDCQTLFLKSRFIFPWKRRRRKNWLEPHKTSFNTSAKYIHGSIYKILCKYHESSWMMYFYSSSRKWFLLAEVTTRTDCISCIYFNNFTRKDFEHFNVHKQMSSYSNIGTILLDIEYIIKGCALSNT